MSADFWLLMVVFALFCIEIWANHKTLNQHYDLIIELKRKVHTLETMAKINRGK